MVLQNIQNVLPIVWTLIAVIQPEFELVKAKLPPWESDLNFRTLNWMIVKSIKLYLNLQKALLSFYIHIRHIYAYLFMSMTSDEINSKISIFVSYIQFMCQLPLNFTIKIIMLPIQPYHVFNKKHIYICIN